MAKWVSSVACSGYVFILLGKFLVLFSNLKVAIIGQRAGEAISLLYPELLLEVQSSVTHTNPLCSSSTSEYAHHTKIELLQ